MYTTEIQNNKRNMWRYLALKWVWSTYAKPSLISDPVFGKIQTLHKPPKLLTMKKEITVPVLVNGSVQSSFEISRLELYQPLWATSTVWQSTEWKTFFPLSGHNDPTFNLHLMLLAAASPFIIYLSTVWFQPPFSFVKL